MNTSSEEIEDNYFCPYFNKFYSQLLQVFCKRSEIMSNTFMDGLVSRRLNFKILNKTSVVCFVCIGNRMISSAIWNK